VIKVIIDVSDKYTYNNSHINGSINIPYDELINNYRSYLNKNEKYFLYCKSGKLSKRAYAVLSSLGYNVNILK
jgi:rhodanese-related sulfurtransferase